MHKKNIVFVLNEYNGHGGAQRVAAILADEFIEDGHNVAVLSINEQKDDHNYFDKNIPIHILHKDGYRAPVAKAISANLKAMKFKKISAELKRRQQLKKRRKDVEKFFDAYGEEDVYVIVIQVWGMQWLRPILYRPNIKIIGQSHESYFASKNSLRYKRILKQYRQVSKFLLLTHKDAYAFENDGFNNVGVMYNPSPFRHLNAPETLYQNKTIVSMGRLVDGKGFDILIEAFSRISDTIPDWKLHIYGEGPAKKSLINLIQVLGMEERVFLKGQTQDSQKALENSSFFVLSSKAEGLPMSLIEAQSCGLPCISTDCAPGIREILIEYKNGLIAPVDDIPLLSRHIQRLATNKDLFYSYSQNAYINSERFDKSVIKNQWYELFKELGGIEVVN